MAIGRIRNRYCIIDLTLLLPGEVTCGVAAEQTAVYNTVSVTHPQEGRATLLPHTKAKVNHCTS